MTKSIENKLVRALEGTDLVEVLQHANNLATEPDLRKIIIHYRIHEGATKTWVQSVLRFLLSEEEEQDDEDKWNLHICNQLVLSEGELKTVNSLIVTTRGDVKKVVASLSRAIRTLTVTLQPQLSTRSDRAVKKAAVAVHARQFPTEQQATFVEYDGQMEVETMPLHGVTSERNSLTPGGKGAGFL